MPPRQIITQVHPSKQTQDRNPGAFGEQIARNFLENKGFRLISQNLRTTFAEADLVMEKEGVILLVEVKQRASWSFGAPEEAVGKRKMVKLQMLAHWLSSQYPNHAIQVDVIAVDGNSISTHLQNIEFS